MLSESLFSSVQTEYTTPEGICRPVIEALGLNFDAAASHQNNRLPRYATIDGVYERTFSTPHRWGKRTGDGLTTSWAGLKVWCNPPYARGPGGTEAWVRKAARESAAGLCPVAALLLPARTETDWFQRWVFPYAEIHFIMSRITFLGHNKNCLETLGHFLEDAPHRLDSAPFPSAIAVYTRHSGPLPGRVTGRTWDPRSSDFDSDVAPILR